MTLGWLSGLDSLCPVIGEMLPHLSVSGEGGEATQHSGVQTTTLRTG